MPPFPPHSDPSVQPSGQPGLDAYTSGLAEGKVYTHLHSDPVFSREKEAATPGKDQPAGKGKTPDKLYVYRLAGADEVRAAKPAVTALLLQALALSLSDAGKNSLAQALTVTVGEDGSLSARNELLLASPEVAIGTNTYVYTPEQARAIGERFIAAVQGLMGQIQAGAKQVRGVSGPLPDVMKGKLEYLNAEQVNANGMDRAHHWRVSFRQTLPVAPGGSAYAPVSAGRCVVLVGGIPGSRSGGALGIESSLAAVRETVESAILQYGSEEEVQYASAEDVTADMVAASKQPDMVYKSAQGGVLAPFWLMEDGEKAATEEGVEWKINSNILEKGIYIIDYDNEALYKPFLDKIGNLAGCTLSLSKDIYTYNIIGMASCKKIEIVNFLDNNLLAYTQQLRQILNGNLLMAALPIRLSNNLQINGVNSYANRAYIDRKMKQNYLIFYQNIFIDGSASDEFLAHLFVHESIESASLANAKWLQNSLGTLISGSPGVITNTEISNISFTISLSAYDARDHKLAFENDITTIISALQKENNIIINFDNNSIKLGNASVVFRSWEDFLLGPTPTSDFTRVSYVDGFPYQSPYPGAINYSLLSQKNIIIILYKKNIKVEELFSDVIFFYFPQNSILYIKKEGYVSVELNPNVKYYSYPKNTLYPIE